MQSYLKRTIFFVLILAIIQVSFEANAEFTVEKLDTSSYACKKSTAEYDFDILGTWSGSPGISSIQFHVNSNGKKYIADCLPITLITPKLSCHVQISYPFNNADIILPTKAPTIDKYTFKNWEKTIGSNSGVSNKIGGVTCVPEEKNTFEPTSITIGDCKYLSGRNIKISGNWADEKNKLSDYATIYMSLDNSNGDFAKCVYKSSQFECDYPGQGRIKIDEQYISYSFSSYKIKEKDSGKSASGCSDDFDDEDIEEYLSSDSLKFLNKILILFSLLLF